MNTTAFIISLLGAIIVFLAFSFARKIESKLKANLIRLAGGIGGFMTLVIIPAVFKMPVEASAKSGEYWFYLIIAGAIVAKVFGPKEKTEKQKT